MGWPWGTFTVNVLGSLVIGFVGARLAMRAELGGRLGLAITVGFLGGFTTYSSFALESVTLMEKRTIFQGLLYIASTLILALFACWVGLTLGRRN
jgi:CrcB protein